MKFLRYLRLMDSLLKSLRKRQKLLSVLTIPFSNSLNNFMQKSLPIIEPLYSFILKLLNPIANRLNIKILKFVEYANPMVFKIKKERIRNGKNF